MLGQPLFGFGFDTATEVALLGISATQAAQGVSIWSIMVFPALFAAGMALVDTTDGVLMLGAYNWAFVKPIRKLYYTGPWFPKTTLNCSFLRYDERESSARTLSRGALVRLR